MKPNLNDFAVFPAQPLPLSTEKALDLLKAGARMVGAVLLLPTAKAAAAHGDLSVFKLTSGEVCRLKDCRNELVPGYSTAAFAVEEPRAIRLAQRDAGDTPHVLVGVTGSIGSGKSSFVSELAACGAVTLDADVFAKEVVAPGSPGLAEVVATFGEAVLTATGELDRKALGAVVFADTAKRKQLEAILHPLIRKAFLLRLFEAIDSSSTNEGLVVAYEIPLLFETGLPYHEFDEKVVVACAEATSVQRLMSGRGYSREEAEERLASQMPVATKRALATIVVENEGTQVELAAKAASLYQELCHRLESD